jgi:hypothetical protein
MKTTIPNCILSYLLLLLALFLPAAAGVMAQNIDFGKSYINVTKGLNGGTVETGDTLEIRATFVVRSGTLMTVAGTGMQFLRAPPISPVQSGC